MEIIGPLIPTLPDRIDVKDILDPYSTPGGTDMSAIQSVTASNGVFTIIGPDGKPQQVDLGTLMMMLNIERTENIDQQIAIQLSEMQDRNTLLTQMTEFMAQCRKAKADGYYPSSFTINGETKTGAQWAAYFGIPWTTISPSTRPGNSTDADKWNAQWDANINAIKGKIDTLNNDSQMDNIKLQNLLEKRGNAFEMATKVMATNNESIKSVLRNL